MTAHAGSEVFKEGPFVVRKVDGGCKLETNLFAKNQKPAPKEGGEEMMGILALFSSDKFYSEFFTNRKKVGQAQKSVKIGFDGDKAVDYPFAAQPGSDEHWRWQYLENTKGLLEGLGKKKSMHVEFSNGKSPYRFEIPLANAAGAVNALNKCSGAKPVEAAGKPPVNQATGAAATKAATTTGKGAKATEATATKANAGKNTGTAASTQTTDKEPANRKQTTDKEPANRKQTTDKEPANRKQTTDKEPANRKQTTNKEPVENKTGEKDKTGKTTKEPVKNQ
ncbi:MAG: hypothetical protein G8345_03045 [Magnetococcales bacterium]|nr:hypothetical protein [Magnetococcales bacterium]NGZ25849.1 hypothetical protein [Magnetococcales bacterium]